MILFEKNNLFDGYSDLLLLGVYSDKAIAEIVMKEKDGAKTAASVVEPLEGDVRENGIINTEKIRLNCEKAIQKLPPEYLPRVKNMACVLGGGISELCLTVETKIREKKDEKISDREIADLASKNKPGFIILEEQLLVDGFQVTNPVGMNGKEITASILSAGWDESLEKMLSDIAISRGMRYLGFLDTRFALIKSGLLLPNDYCAIFIFEKETTICVIRNNRVSAISHIGNGYGIINERVAQKFGVGQEEGKSIADNFRDNKLNREVIEQGVSEISDKIYSVFSGADKTSLLPRTVYIFTPEKIPELKVALTDAKWLTGLPIERNAIVNTGIKISDAILHYLNQ